MLRKENFGRLLAVLGLLLVACAAAAPSAHAAPPACCTITSINVKTGIAAAKVNATGEQFQFKLNNPVQLASLRVGQGIYANLKTSQVSLDGRRIVGHIVSVTPSSTRPPAGADGVRITSIDAAQGKVTVQLLATGEQIYFTVPGSSIQSHGLAVGQTMKFEAIRSLQIGGICPCGQHTDGTCACACIPECVGACSMGQCRNGVQGLGTGRVTKQTPGAPVGLAAPSGGARAPAASILSIDTKADLVSAKINATGQQFQFRMNNPTQLRTLRVGQAIYVNLAAKQVSLNGTSAAGTITSVGAAPVDGAVPH